MAKNKNKGKKRPKEKVAELAKSGLKTICEDNKTLKPYCQSGLRAIKSEYRGKIKVPDTNLFGSSVDFDTALKKDYPNENRWDYGFEYDGNFIFIEFHPAQTSEIAKLCKKVIFTTNWLKSNCPEIFSLPKFEEEERQFYWVSSGNNDVRLTPFGSQSKKLAISKIRHVGGFFDYSKIKKRGS